MEGVLTSIAAIVQSPALVNLGGVLLAGFMAFVVWQSNREHARNYKNCSDQVTSVIEKNADANTKMAVSLEKNTAVLETAVSVMRNGR